tara:strand:+ start:2423 stop:2848 length:426 start_codon:yes stop_codon:yes gene_type:complete
VGIKDYCKVFFTDDPTSYNSSGGSAPQQIIDGRVSVHGIIASSYTSVSGTFSKVDSQTVQDNRCYYLCRSNSHSDIAIKFCGLIEMGLTSGGPFTFFTGGNGILFEDGVFLGKDALAPNGADAAEDFTKSITVLYTGGANT